jgi:cytochrome c oxidase subunit 2
MPQSKLVVGYQAIMPTFQGQVNEEGVMSLIEYIKSLSASNRPAGGVAQAAPGPSPGPAGVGR